MNPAEFEIVGFNGRPLVACGRAMPVVRRRIDENYAILELRDGIEQLQWWPKDTAEEFAAEQRWTAFNSPLSIPIACQKTDSISPLQPMVVYVSDGLLANANESLREELYDGEHLAWKMLNVPAEKWHATCCTDKTAAFLLNGWGEKLLKRFDAMASSGRDHDYLLRIADDALCSSIDRNLRFQSYLRYTMVQQPEKARRTFDMLIAREFPNIGWIEFIDARNKVRDVLQTALSIQTALIIATPSRPTSTQSKVRGIAAERARPFEILTTH